MGTESGEKYWYNMASGEVEHGMLSPSVDRVGPFDSADEASHALDVLRANSAKWDQEDRDDHS
ncbi:MAG: SPOR domain-containing protein [Actinobacteria bacterium]|uniref:Unannotated protein n=1 Tax=freshwater metagenome TaxID=449393 RepID=A0A6J7GXJ5_9ZZZZ|nr:SPOR domain-containing protein [Actinomycetota bacterium]